MHEELLGLDIKFTIIEKERKNKISLSSFIQNIHVIEILYVNR